jgi:hypothetical protein
LPGFVVLCPVLIFVAAGAKQEKLASPLQRIIMVFNPDIHQRHSIRLKDYDYSQAGAYFVTLCAWHRECLFGDIFDGEMRLNALGQVVESVCVG